MIYFSSDNMGEDSLKEFIETLNIFDDSIKFSTFWSKSKSTF